ncbi:hypothetical protein [Micromonospora sp. WMMD812]|uniref:hypothetical protein n=1 Tax=Micromonospora sp. WMMD812 TaxID=3015152 RepID=UPI00248C7CEE|nr:hypothetical protein [Micromonospora sp. WMMD812]WBB67645.1 hypothetical protein O7603_31970 [Micromonospora sp. WMMD812]
MTSVSADLRVKAGADVPVMATIRGAGYRLAPDCSVQIVRDPGVGLTKRVM